jgi:hypothetical protein
MGILEVLELNPTNSMMLFMMSFSLYFLPSDGLVFFEKFPITWFD